MASPGFAASVQAEVQARDAAASNAAAGPCFDGGGGSASASASCIVDQYFGGTFSASGSAHAEYGHLSGSASLAVAGLVEPFIHFDQSQFSEYFYTAFADHLYVAGTGNATATIHFSGNHPGNFRVCATGTGGSQNCGISTGSFTVDILAGDGAGHGFGLTGENWLAADFGPGGLQGRSSASTGPVVGYLDITGIDITGAGVTGPITSESGAMYTADGVTSAPEPVLWPATALVLFVSHRSRSK